jgi:orotate phosphoribosyltransferase
MNIAQKISAASKLTGEFVLRSGEVSNTYFDKYLFESDPLLLKAIAEQLAQLVPSDTDIVAGLEMGGIPVVTAVSQITGIPAAFIRKARKDYGTQKYAEGPELTGKNVVLVEDVVSSGGAILNILAMLNADGITPTLALCVIDRETGGRAALQQRGVELKPLFTMSEIANA